MATTDRARPRRPVLRRTYPSFLLLVALLLLGAQPGDRPSHAQQPEFPPLTGRVVDRADLLSPADEAEIEAALAAHEQETTNQIVVVTLESLQGLPVEDYAYRLGRHWGIGEEGTDDGALLIVVPEERVVRIEVGYGLEGQLTDALGRVIIENEILPRFRQGDFAGGIKVGVTAMLQALGGTYQVPRQGIYARDEREEVPGPISLLPALPILLIFLFHFVFSRLNRRGRHRRRRYGGPILIPGGFGGGRRGGFGGGGGGFGGGGGGFGGGGASGRW